MSIKYIHDAASLISNFRYFIILGGGLTLGYTLSWRLPSQVKICRVTLYGALAVSLYWLIDASLLIIRNLGASLPTALDNIYLTLLPLVTIIAMIALLGSSSKRMDILSKNTLIATFVSTQLYYLATQAVQFSRDVAYIESPWLAFLEIAASPLLITSICYCLFSKIGNKLEGIYYAVLFGVAIGVVVELTWGLILTSQLILTNEVKLIVLIVWMFCFCGKHELPFN